MRLDAVDAVDAVVPEFAVAMGNSLAPELESRSEKFGESGEKSGAYGSSALITID